MQLAPCCYRGVVLRQKYYRISNRHPTCTVHTSPTQRRRSTPTATRMSCLSYSSSARYSPMHIASQNGHLEAVCKLVESGASVDPSTKNLGWTPLYMASRNGQLDVCPLYTSHASDDHPVLRVDLSRSRIRLSHFTLLLSLPCSSRA